jgi:glycosyltransferase involved in cell wall biosynthesis
MSASFSSLALERFAVVGYKDDTGIGRQCHNMKSVLGIGVHLVAPSRRLPGHAIESGSEKALPFEASDAEVETHLQHLDGIIVIERNKWHPRLFEIVKKLRKCLIVIPNWEWFDPTDPCYQLVDHFVAHSDYTKRFLVGLGYSNVTKLTPPIDLSLLPARTIDSPITSFFHNAGVIDQNDRKGTSLVLSMWSAKRPSSAQLLIRYQKSDMLVEGPPVLRNVSYYRGSLPSPSDLYSWGHCALQPSRLEGLGYMVLEPILCGIPTITTNVPPMNEWQHGTLTCPAYLSPDKPVPVTRGIGCAHLVDVDVNVLASIVENLEGRNSLVLSRGALEFRKRFDHAAVRIEWQKFLQNC